MLNLRTWLRRCIGGLMLVTFFGGLIVFPDAPFHKCSESSGYCGKQEQPHTARGGYEESNGLHQSQDLLQWSTLFAIRDCRQLLPPMSPIIQVSR